MIMKKKNIQEENQPSLENIPTDLIIILSEYPDCHLIFLVNKQYASLLNEYHIDRIWDSLLLPYLKTWTYTWHFDRISRGLIRDIYRPIQDLYEPLKRMGYSIQITKKKLLYSCTIYFRH